MSNRDVPANMSKEELMRFINQQRATIKAKDTLIANLEKAIKDLTKPKGDGSHRCHLCHSWVNPSELYEVKADACETCMQVQLSENRRHAENQVPVKWYHENQHGEITPKPEGPAGFEVDLRYEFRWDERAVGSWEGSVKYCGVRLPYILYIGAQFESDEPDRQAMLMKTDGKQAAGRQIIDELSINGVAAAQNYLQSRLIIDHQESKFD